MLIGLNWLARTHQHGAEGEPAAPWIKGGCAIAPSIVHVLQVHLLNARFKTGVGQLRKQMGVVTRASVPLSNEAPLAGALHAVTNYLTNHSPCQLTIH